MGLGTLNVAQRLVILVFALTVSLCQRVRGCLTD